MKTSSDRDAHLADVLAFKCAHAVPEAKPCADFGGLCPFMAPGDAYLRSFKTPKCAEVTPAMWPDNCQTSKNNHLTPLSHHACTTAAP